MLYILGGLALWTLAHGLKRFFPNIRQMLGNGGRGIVSLGSFIAIGLMANGFITTEPVELWQSTEWLHAINNILMLIAVYLFAVGGAKTRLALVLRHPMLDGLMVWAVAHLLVNGDQRSMILFTGFIGWAYLTKQLIDRAEPWVLPDPPSIGKEIGVAVASVVVFVVIVHVHDFIGPYPLWWGWPLQGPLATILSPIF